MRSILLLPLLFLFACGTSSVPSGEVLSFSVPRELASARLVFQRDGQIVLSDPVADGNERVLAEGTWPRWSPDGTWIAFLQGNHVARVFPETGEVELLSEVRNPRTLAVPKDGTTVYFTGGDEVLAVNVETKEVETRLEGRTFLELDVVDHTILGTEKVLGGFRVRSEHVETNEETDFGKGCSASFSPQGDFVTRNEGDHTQLAILNVRTGEPELYLPAPPGRKTDNQFWSTHPDWVVSMDEDSGHIYAHRISDRQVFTLTKNGSGDRPDLWVPDS